MDGDEKPVLAGTGPAPADMPQAAEELELVGSSSSQSVGFLRGRDSSIPADMYAGCTPLRAYGSGFTHIHGLGRSIFSLSCGF